VDLVNGPDALDLIRCWLRSHRVRWYEPRQMTWIVIVPFGVFIGMLIGSALIDLLFPSGNFSDYQDKCKANREFLEKHPSWRQR
jgi:hypothetical protein